MTTGWIPGSSGPARAKLWLTHLLPGPQGPTLTGGHDDALDLCIAMSTMFLSKSPKIVWLFVGIIVSLSHPINFTCLHHCTCRSIPFTRIFFQDTKNEIFSNFEPLYHFMSGTIHISPANQEDILFIPQVASEAIPNLILSPFFLSLS